MSGAGPRQPLGTYGTDAHIGSGEPDAILRYAEHPRGFAELRQPDGAEPHPLAIIFHGGCWKAGTADTAYTAPLATRLAERGVATLNVDYREVGDGGGWPTSFADWSAAMELTERLIAGKRVDPERVTLIGHSAGGLPALWLPSPGGPDGPLGVRAPGQVRAAILLDAPADLTAEADAFDCLCEFEAVAPFMGGPPAEQPARYAALAPGRLAPRVGRVHFAQARLDVPSPASLAALEQGGARATAQRIKGAGHFDILTPGHPHYEVLEPDLLEIIGAP